VVRRDAAVTAARELLGNDVAWTYTRADDELHLYVDASADVAALSDRLASLRP
jgi:hypothetical protein